MSTTIENYPRFQRLFRQSKLACLGRYALSVPNEAELVWGTVWFPSKVEVIVGDLVQAREAMDEDIERLKRKSNSFEMVHVGEGPIVDSLQMRYYESKYAKLEKMMFFDTYISMNNRVFIIGDATEERETQEIVAKRQLLRANSLSVRQKDDVPTSPGYCIEEGFMASNFYDGQEMVSAGLYIPSLPDVTFSIRSNKNAYGDLKREEFERMKREELGLLARIKSAQEIQGDRYPERTVLREGKRTVQHWQGEESLVRRADGVHDFEWCSIGTPKDVANPAEFTVHMYTKVADNMVGAAEKSSLSDEEAIALWDKLLSGLKFRVKVPGAPEGSYYFLPNAKPVAGAQP